MVMKNIQAKRKGTRKPAQKVQKKKRTSSTDVGDRVVAKITRIKTSGKMMAIMGYILDKELTDPSYASITITSDGHVLGMHRGDIGYNDYIGSIHDFVRNVNGLANVAELTQDEKKYMLKLLREKNLAD
jgi:hypothetical protein